MSSNPEVNAAAFLLCSLCSDRGVEVPLCPACSMFERVKKSYLELFGANRKLLATCEAAKNKINQLSDKCARLERLFSEATSSFQWTTAEMDEWCAKNMWDE